MREWRDTVPERRAPTLTDLRLALVLGWTLPQWFVRNGWSQLVEKCKDEPLPWKWDQQDEAHYDRLTDIRQKRKAPRLH
jgi:hypothetical protein